VRIQFPLCHILQGFEENEITTKFKYRKVYELENLRSSSDKSI